MHELYFTASKAEQFLCDAIRHIDRIDATSLSRQYHELGDKAAFDAAQRNGVVPIVAHSLATHVLKDSLLQPHWVEAYEATRVRIEAYMSELDRVAAALAQREIPLVALKNSGIVRGIYPFPGSSPMGDVDVLIRPADFHAAHGVLEDLGYTLKFRNVHESDDINEAFAHGGAEYSVMLPSGEHLWFELQWRPIAGRWIQPGQEPKADDLIERAVGVDGSEVMLLSPEDNLLQVCLHTAKHSFVRAPGFRLHTDVDRIVSCERIDWELFVRKVKLLHVATPCYISLAMARQLLGTNVPASVLTRIAPPAWKTRILTRWLDRVGVFNPDERKWSNPGFIVFVGLLYDRLSDIWLAVFPPLEEMQKRFGGVTRMNVPFFHFRRIASLIIQRTGI